MPAAILIQFCCGSLYAWSVFNKPIDKLIYGEVRNMSPITFYIAVGCFGISAAVMGPWLERRGPMLACLLGTSLFFTGNLVTALALYYKQIWLVFLGYGVISGYGLGLCYISPVSALQKWFPDRRGLASGMAVCGFGAGSIAIAKAQIPLIDSVGLPLTFVVLGSGYFIIMALSALVLRTPPPGYSVEVVVTPITEEKQKNEGKQVVDMNDNPQTSPDSDSQEISLIDALTSKDFRLMYVMFLANAIFGLVVISRLSNMVTDIFGGSADEASTVVSINGGFNLGGRLFFSILSDYIGRKNCYLVMLTSQLIILGAFSSITTTKTYWAFLMTMWILTSCYGAGFGVIPALLSDTFGPSNIGACHGVILTAWSTAGVVGGLIFTAVFNEILRQGYTTADHFPYNVNVWWIFVIVLIGWVTLFFVTPTAKDKAFTRRPKAFFRRMFNRVSNRQRTFEMNSK
jgi:MFS family permease